MIRNVIKRDNSVVAFDSSKVYNAIIKAMYSSGFVDIEIAETISQEIGNYYTFKGVETITIKEIESLVYNMLIKFEQVETAKAYEGYRAVQQYKRENDPLVESVLGLVNLTNEEVAGENANKDANLVSTQRDLIAGEVSKYIARNYMIPPHLTQLEDIGAIKIHDKDYYISPLHNCDLINLDDMLQNGTVINKRMIRKPKSLRTAMTITTQIAAQVSSSQYGGQTISISHLAPFVRITEEAIRAEVKLDYPELDEERVEKIVERKLKKEIKDSVQLFNYQLVTISSTSGQSPFLSLALYISEKPGYERETAMLIEEFLKQRIEGMENEFGIKISQTFPKLLYFTDENNIHPTSEYYYLTQLAAESVAKRLSPDFISVKKMKELYGVAFPCMGCRSFLTPIKKEDGTYDLYGRGNIGVCTLNLPHVALSSKGDKDKFFKLLELRLSQCVEVGVLRYEKLKNFPAKVAPILWMHGGIARLKADEPIGKALKERNFTASIGYIGLHETVKYMTGHTLTEKEGIAFGLEIMKYLDDFKKRAVKETGILFGTYGTPSESTAGWFSKKLQEQFGDIEGITDKGYLINSYHIDIKEEVNAFDKLMIEQQFAQYSLGGTITYIEVANMVQNCEAVIQLIQFMYDNNIYAEINTESDMCSTCGFNGTMSIDDNLVWYCPQCGENNKDKISVVRRTCGYISDNNWGVSRTLDIINRVKHL